MLESQFRKAIFSKRKRQRKKDRKRLIDMCGYDNEGLVNYAKIAILMRDKLTKKEFSRLMKRNSK